MDEIKKKLEEIIQNKSLRGLYISNAASLVSSYLRDSHPLAANVLLFLTMLYAKNATLEQNSETLRHIHKIEDELAKIEKKLESCSAVAKTQSLFI